MIIWMKNMWAIKAFKIKCVCLGGDLVRRLWAFAICPWLKNKPCGNTVETDTTSIKTKINNHTHISHMHLNNLCPQICKDKEYKHTTFGTLWTYLALAHILKTKLLHMCTEETIRADFGQPLCQTVCQCPHTARQGSGPVTGSPFRGNSTTSVCYHTMGHGAARAVGQKTRQKLNWVCYRWRSCQGRNKGFRRRRMWAGGGRRLVDKGGREAPGREGEKTEVEIRVSAR